MAKVRFPIIEIQGQLGNLVFVNSKIYGGHVRQPRGTHRKATINHTLRQNAGNASLVTGIAKRLHQVFKSAGGAFKQRDLWQVMLGRMFKVTPVTAAELLKSLDGLEMNAAYPLQALIGDISFATCIRGKQLIAAIPGGLCVDFADKLEADSYYLELTVVWMDRECERVEAAVVATGWIPIDSSSSAFEFNYEKPGWAACYLVLVKVQGGRKREAIGQLEGMGMRVILVMVDG